MYPRDFFYLRMLPSILKLSMVLLVCQALFAPFIASCNAADQYSDPSKWKPGQVLSEKSINLGNGYKQVHRSIVNPAGHWESVGHFSFVYFEDTRLCQCSASDVLISRDGRYAIFVKETDGRLTLFDSKTSVARILTKDFVGLPDSASWDEKGEKVVVTVKKWVSEKKDYEEEKIPVDLHP